MMEDNKSMTAVMIPLGRDVQVLFEDNNGLIALEKPAGIKSHPNGKGLESSCLVRAKYNMDDECYYWQEGETEKRLYLLNRLDSPTSGIIIVSFSQQIASVIKKLFKEKEIHKVYYAIVRGCPNRAMKVWTDNLVRTRTPEKGRLRVQQGGISRAITHVKIEKMDDNGLGVSLIRMEPKTGRTHQLRIQSSLRHHPILGDKTYGDFKLNRAIERITKIERLYLHSAELHIEYPLNNAIHSFSVTSPIPEAFKELLQANAKFKRAFF